MPHVLCVVTRMQCAVLHLARKPLQALQGKLLPMFLRCVAHGTCCNALRTPRVARACTICLSEWEVCLARLATCVRCALLHPGRDPLRALQ